MLKITTATTLGPLAHACADVLRHVPEDPFTAEWIATPTGAIRGWLNRQLADSLFTTDEHGNHAEGIAANIVFARADDLNKAFRGDDAMSAVRRGDPWSTDAMTWELMRLVANGTVSRHGTSSGDADSTHRIREEPLANWARRQAKRYDRYHLYRPEMIRRWLAMSTGKTGAITDPNEREQVVLYQALASAIAVDNPATATNVFATDDVTRFESLPERLVFFGFMLAPAGAEFLGLINLVAQTRDVYCYFLDPAPGVAVDGHPTITQTWGRSDIASRKLRSETNDSTTWLDLVDTTTDKPNLLTDFQRHIVGGAPQRRALDTNDRSVIIHNCHGLTRQIEVLHDELVRRLVDDPTLAEDEIVVLCPDPQAIAPLVTEVFERSKDIESTNVTSPQTPWVRYHVEGQSSRFVNPVADAFGHLLALVTGRVTSQDLLTFCQLKAVRDRWAFDDSTIELFRGWAQNLHVRWGIDAHHRTQFGMPQDLTLGTWARALDRLALGVAYAPDVTHATDELVLDLADGPIAPQAVEGNNIDRFGQLRDIVTRIAELAADANEPIGVAGRLERLRDAAISLFAPSAKRPEQLDSVLEICRPPQGDDADADFPISLIDLRPHLLAQLEGHGGAPATYRGCITFTSPDAVRGVPYKVVALLDFGDHWIPSGSGDGGDLMTIDFRPGDPEPRRDVRASLLSAVLAAKNGLVITRTAQTLSTNSGVPEGTLLGELLDALGEVVAPDTPRDSLVDAVTVLNTRQATDVGNFDGTKMASFDVDALIAAQHSISADEPSLLIPGDTPIGQSLPDPEDEAVVYLADLCRFLRDPSKFVTTRTMDVRLPYDDGEPSEFLPTELDPLERHQMRGHLLDELRARIDDAPPATTDELPPVDARVAHARERHARAHDLLPVGITGDFAFDREWQTLERIREKVWAYRKLRTEHTPLHIDIALPDGRRLVGDVELYRANDPGDFDHILLDYDVTTEVKPGERLVAVTRLLAAATCLNDDVSALWTVVVRRDGSSATAFQQRCETDPESQAHDVTILADLVRLYDLAQLGAVPLPTSLITSTKSAWKSSWWNNGFVDEFIKSSSLRFLYGYIDEKRFRSLPVHDDDPRFDDLHADEKVADTSDDRAEHLRVAVLEWHLGGRLQSSSSGKRLVPK